MKSLRIELKSDLVKKYEEKKLSLYSTKRPRVYKRETVTARNLSSHVCSCMIKGKNPEIPYGFKFFLNNQNIHEMETPQIAQYSPFCGSKMVLIFFKFRISIINFGQTAYFQAMSLRYHAVKQKSKVFHQCDYLTEIFRSRFSK